MKSDGTLITGTVGKDLSAEEAHKAAEWVGLNLLSTIRAEIGSLDKVGLYTHANSVSQEMQGLSLLYFLTCFIFFLRFCLHFIFFFYFFSKSLTYLLPSIYVKTFYCTGNPKRKQKVKKVHKLVGFVNCTDDFEAQPSVINGCSDLLFSVFGEKGIHARSAVGTNALPLGIAVEIEAIFEVEDEE